MLADEYMSLSNQLVQTLISITGSRHAYTDPQDQISFLEEPRNKFFGKTPLVLQPGCTGEVAAILRLANENNIGVVPQGGNTGLTGGQVPDNTNTQIILNLSRMNKIREIVPQNNSVTVEAGVVLETLQATAEGVDRLFPLSLGSQGSCQIGGNLSTNAGGTGVLAYGNTRDLVLGIEVVLADGTIINQLGSLRKDNTGYDLKHLFIGAEGTLGIITAATLKLYPRPKSIYTAFVGLDNPDQALKFFNIAKNDAGSMLTAFELLPKIGLEFSLRHLDGSRDPLTSRHPWYVLLELSITTGSVDGASLIETIFEQAFAQNLLNDAVLAGSIEQGRQFWALRHGLSDVQRAEGGSIKHDISVAVSDIPEFLERALKAVEKAIPDCRPCPFGHMGDGNLHFNISQPVGADRAEFLARWEEVNSLVHNIVIELNGSISAEHGIGQLKREILKQAKDPASLRLMHILKKSLDPNGIMNPGKVL